MRLVLKKVGALTTMDADGTPEEIAAFVSLVEYGENLTLSSVPFEHRDAARKIRSAILANGSAIAHSSAISTESARHNVGD